MDLILGEKSPTHLYYVVKIIYCYSLFRSVITLLVGFEKTSTL